MLNTEVFITCLEKFKIVTAFRRIGPLKRGQYENCLGMIDGGKDQGDPVSLKLFQNSSLDQARENHELLVKIAVHMTHNGMTIKSMLEWVSGVLHVAGAH